VEAPAGLVRAYLKMLPRLQAEEALATIDAVALGMGAFQPDDARAMIDRLRAVAAPDLPPQRPAPASKADMAAAGFGYRVVPPRAVPAEEASDG
jgi:hypothetical protein